MRYAGLIENDIVDSDDGICVSLWMQGCPHHCKGCHNPETWDFNGGKEIDIKKLVENVITSLTQNGVNRNFSILGGEPLAPENIKDTVYIINCVRNKFPKIKIYLWTGYTMEYLMNCSSKLGGSYNISISKILRNVDILIEGLYKEELRDTSLLLRGSSNQRIFRKNLKGLFTNK